LRHLTELDPSTRGAAASGGFGIGIALRNLVGGGVTGAIVTRFVLLARFAYRQWGMESVARRPYAARGVAVLRKITFVIFFDIRIVFAVISAVGFDRS
jgi:hypothetical protein